MKMKKALAFDDVLLIPKESNIPSRSLVDPSSILKNIRLRIPLISSPMDTVTESAMAREVGRLGGLGIVHRMCSVQEQIEFLNFPVEDGYLTGFAIGVGEDEKERFKKVYNEFGDLVSVVCVDIANGHSIIASDMVKFVKDTAPNIHLMAGSVATGEGYHFLAELGADSVRVGIGGGCHTKSTKILMADGTYKNIDKILPGEKVINKNGNPVVVKNVMNNGYKKVIKVRNSSWETPVYVTPEHKYFQSDLSDLKSISKLSKRKIIERKKKNGDGRIKWLEIGSDKRSVGLIPRNINFDLPENIVINTENFVKRKTAKIDIKKVQSNYNLGYIFGMMLGDGHAFLNNNGKSEVGRISLYLGAHEQNLADKFLNYIYKEFGAEGSYTVKDNLILVNVYSKPLAHLFSEFGKKNEKHLPKKYYAKNKKYILGIFDGLIDSDGHIEKSGRVSFYNTSQKLKELFNFCCISLDKTFSNVLREPRSGNLCGINWNHLLPCYQSRVHLSNRKSENYSYVKFLSKEEVPLEMEVWDIEVDCPTHSYIANNVIVHNSICKTRIQTGFGVPTLTSVMWAAKCKHKLSHNAAIIADGGIRAPGDLAKSIAAGADAVICGGIFAGTAEAPGDVIKNNDGFFYKKYRGMASEEIQIEKRGGLKPGTCAEGTSTLVRYKGDVVDVFEEFEGGLRSALTYNGSWNVKHFQETAEFIEITDSGLRESHSYGTRKNK